MSDETILRTATETGGKAGPATIGRRIADQLRGRRPLSRRWHLALGLFAPMVVAIVGMVRMAPHTVDDSYISYRYAQNLAAGHGLVYNVGERIEGYTNFLWTVLLAGAAAVGADLDVFAKLLGGAAACGVLAGIYLLSNAIRPLRAAPCLATWLLASTAVFNGYAVYGLETQLFAFAVVAGAWLLLREERRDARIPWSGLAFAAAGLTRPEAPLYLGVWMLFMGGPALLPRAQRSLEEEDARDVEGRRAVVVFVGLLALGGLLLAYAKLGDAPRTTLVAGAAVALAVGAIVLAYAPRALLSRRNLVRGAIFVGVVGAHLLWRRAYYGRWVPNTLSAKTGDFAQQLAGGAAYVERLIDHEGPVVYVALLGLAAALVTKNRALLACAAITALGTAYVVLVGGDWMPLFRFMVPLLPFAYLATGVAVRAALEQRHLFVNLGFAALAIVTVVHRVGREANDVEHIVKREKGFWDRAAGGTAAWFKNREAERGRDQTYGAIALGDIGQVGYETGYPIFDVLGLVDPVISELPGGYTRKTGPGYRDHFFASKPRYFVMISKADCRSPTVPTSVALYQDRRFRQAYHVAGRVPMDSHAWCIWERRDAPGAEPEPTRPAPGVTPQRTPLLRPRGTMRLPTPAPTP